MANANAFALLADPTRRRVFESLKNGPRAVGDIAAGFAVTRPAVSQHLKALKDAGFVTERRSGRHRFYAIDTAALAELRVWVDSFWDAALAGFKAHAEAAPVSLEKATNE